MATFYATHVFAKTKLAVDIKHRKCKLFTYIDRMLSSALLLKLRHESTDMLLHHGLLFEKRSMREGAIQRAPDRDCIVVTSDCDGILLSIISL
jgi:hypothetical protein